MLGESIQAFALAKNHTKAHQKNLTLAKIGDIAWLNSATKLAAVDQTVSMQLAAWYLSQNKLTSAEHYLLTAKSLGSTAAISELAVLWHTQERFDKVLNELTNEITLWDEAVANAKVHALVATGQISVLEELLNKLQVTPELAPLYQSTYQTLVDFDVLNTANVQQERGDQPVAREQHCPLSITLAASQLNDLKRWQNLAQTYKGSKLSQFLCVSRIKYIPPFAHDCNLSPQPPIMCDEAKLGSKLSAIGDISSDYLALMLPKGGANVHMGILYLDRADDFTVFSHELTHLLGFIDEYTLSATHPVCQRPSNELGWNIATLPSTALQDGYLSRAVAKQMPWYSEVSQYIENVDERIPLNRPLSPNGFGFFQADTCTSSEKNSAIKPLQQATLLRNHDFAIPEQYLTLLAKDVHKYKMPSYHYNIGVALYREKQGSDALKWLNQAVH
ncbi:hypothetical protein [Thalassotalea euphylliae]|uniref:hypothetical protein n=1 Tax=Thalassotalea euphylliae TaxID=1655234 RepID=UPI0011C068D4|nr:hypothetical protein [Thalassotalea euphylliae]